MLDLDALRNEPDKPASQTPAFDQRALRKQVAALLSLEAEILDEQRSLIEFGLDSIMVIRLQTHLAARGLVVPPLAALLEEPTLAAWWRQLDGAPAAATMDGAERPVRLIHQAEEFALTPMQQAYWIGRQDDQPLGGVGCHLYAEFDGQGVDAGRLETAMRQLLQRHPMLRARFLPSGKQTVMAQSPWPGLTHYDLSGVEANAVDGQLLAIRERLSHRRLRVEQGEVCDLRLASLPGRRSRLYLNLDLLVADVLSFELFLGDLAAFYLDQGDRLPELHSTFAGYLASQRQRDATAREVAKAYWQERLPTLPGGPALPLARQPEQVTRARFVRRSFMLDHASWAACRSRRERPA
ncbi:condensation domain-containing protein [Azorhizophilus paspali]|uniref:condensation domain-containing protein n=1 Tax=Azorhizophilus paspali TaxID=69963 RepID=UPI00363BE8A3